MIRNTFNKIYVIESLPSGERRTGKELHDDLLRWKSSQIGYLSVEYHQPESKAELLECLEAITHETEVGDIFPVLHFELHGSEDGLSMANGEFIEWEELRSVLTRINTNVSNNLLVTLAACRGAYLTLLLKPAYRAPVWGLVGPVIDVSDKDIAISFNAFYNELLTSFDGDRAVRRLNESLSDLPYRYDFVNCMSIFKGVYRKHLAEDYTPEALQKRTNRMADKAAGHPRWLGMPRRKVKRLFKRELMKRRRSYFEKYRETFFMYDLFPENKQRFPVIYEEVMDN